MVKAETLNKGQKLKIELKKVYDRLPKEIFKEITLYPFGKLIGFKMVDGNNFGLVLELKNGLQVWFFENELSEILTEDKIN